MPNLYAAARHVVLTSVFPGVVVGLEPPLRSGTIPGRGYGLPRRPLLGTSVNKGKKKGRGC
jgi:hypothetical protein